MNINKMKLSKKINAVASLAALLIVLASGTASAQKAPPFSNDILMDNQTYVFFMVDRLEYNMNSGLNPLVWDAQGYIGKDYNKFWIKTEGEVQTARAEGEMEFQGRYSHAITTHFDVQAGLRYDIGYLRSAHRSRGFAVIGLQGLAPYLFEVDAKLNVSQDGDLSARVEAEYDFPITQR